jgi:hypothetical protein
MGHVLRLSDLEEIGEVTVVMTQREILEALTRDQELADRTLSDMADSGPHFVCRLGDA